MVAINKIINNHLAALENAFGKEHSENTAIAYSNEGSFVVKGPTEKHPKILSAKMIILRTKHLNSQ